MKVHYEDLEDGMKLSSTDSYSGEPFTKAVLVCKHDGGLFVQREDGIAGDDCEECDHDFPTWFILKDEYNDGDVIVHGGPYSPEKVIGNPEDVLEGLKSQLAGM